MSSVRSIKKIGDKKPVGRIPGWSQGWGKISRSGPREKEAGGEEGGGTIDNKKYEEVSAPRISYGQGSFKEITQF